MKAMDKETVKNATVKTVMPIIAVDSVDELPQFYTEKLGFGRLMGVVGKDGQFDFVVVMLDGASIMFTRTRERLNDTRTTDGKHPWRSTWRWMTWTPTMTSSSGGASRSHLT